MKPVPAIDYPITDVLLKRWSPRSFSEKKVSQSDIDSLFEAARWAPSCFNEQPWWFVYVLKGTAQYESFLSCIVETNQLWAKSAPMLLVAAAKMTFERNGKSNPYAWYDTGMAMSQLTMEASKRDIFVHQMGGFLRDEIRKTAKIPDGFDPVVMAAIGYLGDSDMLVESLRNQEKAPQTRRKIMDFVFQNTWSSTDPSDTNDGT